MYAAGKTCLEAKTPDMAQFPPLVSGPAMGARLGWAMEDLTIEVQGGMVQNDTKALCPVVAPCTAANCEILSVGMTLRRVNISAIAPSGGVDGFSPGTGTGPLVSVRGTKTTITDR